MTTFSDSLKSWRKQRRFSQLDLALEAEVSSRHLSFLETGRAKPSREMVERLGAALHLPLAVRNQMLTLAGFAARYPGRDWQDAQMAPIRAAIDHMLMRHDPYPGFALDRMWRVVRMNQSAQRLFGLLAVREGADLLEISSSDLLPQVIVNWPEVAQHLALRLRTESAGRGGDARFDAVAEELTKAAGPSGTEDTPPVIPTIYRIGDQQLSLFSTIAQFGTAEDLSLDDLKIELFFPSDEASKAVLLGMAGAA